MTPDEKDTLCVAAKRQASEYIKEYYAAFGWVFVEQKDDAQYEDTEVLYFERPHFIADKDDLQLLQVKLEIALNKMGKLEQRKSNRASVIGIMLGLFGAALAVGGVCLIVFLPALWAYITGGALCASGAAVFAICALYARRILKEDIQKYDRLMQDEKDKIEEYRSAALSIRRA